MRKVITKFQGIYLEKKHFQEGAEGIEVWSGTESCSREVRTEYSDTFL